jgi:hypothetical protein
MKTNQFLTATGIALTLALTTSAFNLSANAQRQPEGGRYQRFQGKIVYICPQFDNINEQIDAMEKSGKPDVPLCASPKGDPAPYLNSSKLPTTLIPLVTASQSIDSFKVSNQQSVKSSECGWLWVRGYGWVWLC